MHRRSTTYGRSPGDSEKGPRPFYRPSDLLENDASVALSEDEELPAGSGRYIKQERRPNGDAWRHLITETSLSI